jgi:dTDP-4-dehydrorhamnose reductase
VKILVTGSAGQLGAALGPALGHHPTVFTTRAELDVCDLESVRKALATHRPDVVINAAAYTDVDGSERDPEAAFRGNALGPRNLAVATGEIGAALVQLSTDYVFDGTAERPYHEFDATHPLSTYGRTKLAGEEAVRAANPRHYVVRTAWLYSTIGRNFALTMCGQAERPEVRVVSDQYGSPTYAPHLADALARLVETGAYGTWHLAGSGGTSWYGLTRALYAALGIATPVRAVSTAEFPRPAPRPRYAVLASLQSPPVRLPPWEAGVRAFALRLRGSG